MLMLASKVLIFKDVSWMIGASWNYLLSLNWKNDFGVNAFIRFIKSTLLSESKHLQVVKVLYEFSSTKRNYETFGNLKVKKQPSELIMSSWTLCMIKRATSDEAHTPTDLNRVPQQWTL